MDQGEQGFIGQVLGGRYRVLSLLGRGGMGAVYEAEQLDLRRQVAVKVMVGRFASDPAAVARFRQEAQAAAAIGHPNITHVIDFHASPGEVPFLVMELLQGGSFRELIRAHYSLPQRRVAFIAAQVLSALGAAHARSIVHRDIKPANIFICSGTAVPDFAKVLDFGVAKLADAAVPVTLEGTFVGTIDFMPPEQARGEVVDGRADIYAVGACMYQALAGRKPFERRTMADLLQAISTESPPPLLASRGDLHPEFVAVVERAMSKDRQDRWQTAEAMQAALMPWAGEASWAKPSLLTVPGSTLGETSRSSSQLEPTVRETTTRRSIAGPFPRARSKRKRRIVWSVVVACAGVATLAGILTRTRASGVLSKPITQESRGLLRFVPTQFAVGELDGDGVDDFIALSVGGSRPETSLVAMSGRTRTPIWASEALDQPSHVSITRKYVVAVDRMKTLYVLDKARGTTLATHVLPDPPGELRGAPDATDSLCVRYRSGRAGVLSLSTGEEQPLAAWCTHPPPTDGRIAIPRPPAIAHEEFWDNPRAVDDGTVRSFVASGKSVEAFRQGTAAAGVFSQRGQTYGVIGFDPDTYATRWKVELPPHTITARALAIGKTCLFVQHSAWESTFLLSCIDLKTGAMRWSRGPGEFWVLELKPNLLYVTSDRATGLELVDPETGKTEFTVTSAQPPAAR